MFWCVLVGTKGTLKTSNVWKVGHIGLKTPNAMGYRNFIYSCTNPTASTLRIPAGPFTQDYPKNTATAVSPPLGMEARLRRFFKSIRIGENDAPNDGESKPQNPQCASHRRCASARAVALLELLARTARARFIWKDFFLRAHRFDFAGRRWHPRSSGGPGWARLAGGLLLLDVLNVLFG